MGKSLNTLGGINMNVIYVLSKQSLDITARIAKLGFIQIFRIVIAHWAIIVIVIVDSG